MVSVLQCTRQGLEQSGWCPLSCPPVQEPAQTQPLRCSSQASSNILHATTYCTHGFYWGHLEYQSNDVIGSQPEGCPTCALDACRDIVRRRAANWRPAGPSANAFTIFCCPADSFRGQPKLVTRSFKCAKETNWADVHNIRYTDRDEHLQPYQYFQQRFPRNPSGLSRTRIPSPTIQPCHTCESEMVVEPIFRHPFASARSWRRRNKPSTGRRKLELSNQDTECPSILASLAWVTLHGPCPSCSVVGSLGSTLVRDCMNKGRLSSRDKMSLIATTAAALRVGHPSGCRNLVA